MSSAGKTHINFPFFLRIECTLLKVLITSSEDPTENIEKQKSKQFSLKGGDIELTIFFLFLVFILKLHNVEKYLIVFFFLKKLYKLSLRDHKSSIE